MVTLISKDGQRYQTEVETESDDGAIEKAFNNIKERGWEHHEYKLEQLERLS